MSPLAMRRVRAPVTISVMSLTVWSILLFSRISVWAKNAFLMALAILSDLKGVIEPSRLTTLRLNRLTSSFFLFITVFFAEFSVFSALFVSILPTKFVYILAKNH